MSSDHLPRIFITPDEELEPALPSLKQMLDSELGAEADERYALEIELK